MERAPPASSVCVRNVPGTALWSSLSAVSLNSSNSPKTYGVENATLPQASRPSFVDSNSDLNVPPSQV